MSDLSPFPVTRKWPALHPQRIQLYSLNTPNGIKVSVMLEETGLPYEPHYVSFDRLEQRSPEYLSLNPYGKIPAIIDPDGPGGRPLTLFESGAIVLHIAERHAGLLPADAKERAAAVAWMFAALTTVQGPIIEREQFILMEKDKSWYAERLPMLQDRVRVRLGELSRHLGDADWLDGAFSAGDLMMVTVLRRLHTSGLLNEYPDIAAYVARGEARPAFRRAFDAQLAVFTGARLAP
jgi:glutathione S-transferase